MPSFVETDALAGMWRATRIIATDLRWPLELVPAGPVQVRQQIDFTARGGIGPDPFYGDFPLEADEISALDAEEQGHLDEEEPPGYGDPILCGESTLKAGERVTIQSKKGRFLNTP